MSTSYAYDAIVVNDQTIKVDNRANIYFDGEIYTDYGFELFYRRGSGIGEAYWTELLIEWGFEPSMYPPIGRVMACETQAKALDLRSFFTKTFAIQYIYEGRSFGILYDHKTATLLISNDWTYWDML